jgi:hypothetical protein
VKKSRADLSFGLVLAAFVLMVSIYVGNNMGNRVLGQVAARTEVAPTPLVTAVAQVKDVQSALGWKKTEVISVATDPAFPDPRVTPIPPATPRPTPRLRVAPGATSAAGALETPTPAQYTSPPLPMPIATHAPGELDTEPPPDSNPT